MRTQNYALKGKEVGQSFVGQTITIRQPETLDECRQLFEDEASLTDSAHSDYVVWLQGRLRAMSAATNEDGSPKYTLTQLQDFASGAVKGRRIGTGGTAREVKPETKVKRAAAGAGNKLFEKCRADEQYLAKMVKLGAVEREDYDAWLAAQPTAAQQAVINS